MFKRIILVFIAILVVSFSSACSTEQKMNSNSKVPQPQTVVVKNEILTELPIRYAVGIPVLMYHSVDEEKDNDAVIGKELFAKHMEYLYRHKYYTASLDELYAHLTGRRALPEKSVVLTFDDGYEDTYNIVMPILKQYGFKSTVFVPAADIGKNLTLNQLKEMRQAGMEIASHSDRHRDLSLLSYEDQVKEVAASKEKLDRLLNQDTKYFCYPNGSYNDVTLRILVQKGFNMAFTINSGWVKPNDNVFTLKRVWMGNSIDLRHLEERLTTENYSIL